MKFAAVVFALFACVYTSTLHPHPYYGWPFLSQYPNVVYRYDQSPEAAPSDSAPQYLQENGPSGRLFFSLLTSLLTTTKTTTTTITSTCTVSTTACSGKKRSIMWREEDIPQENER